MTSLSRQDAFSLQVLLLNAFWGQVAGRGFTNVRIHNAPSLSVHASRGGSHNASNVHATRNKCRFRQVYHHGHELVRDCASESSLADVGKPHNPDMMVAKETALLLVAVPLLALTCLWPHLQRSVSLVMSSPTQIGSQGNEGVALHSQSIDHSDGAEVIAGGVRHTVAFVFVIVPFCCLALLFVGGALLSIAENWDGATSRDFIATSITGLRYTDAYPTTFAGRLMATETASMQLIIFGAAVFLFEDHASSAVNTLLGLSTSTAHIRSFARDFLGLQLRLFMVFFISACFFGCFFFFIRGWPLVDAIEVAFAAELGAGVTLDPTLPKTAMDKILIVFISSWGMSFIALICSAVGNQLLKPMLHATGNYVDANAGRRFARLVFVQLPCVMLMLTWMVAIPLALIEDLDFIDAFEDASSASSCGIVALLNAAPKTWPGSVLVMLASSVGISVLTLATGAVSHAAEPLLHSTCHRIRCCFGSGIPVIMLSGIVLQPLLVGIVALPLGILLHICDSSVGTITQCTWFVITVLLGGGTVYTKYMPQQFLAKLLITLYSSLNVSVVAMSVMTVSVARTSSKT